MDLSANPRRELLFRIMNKIGGAAEVAIIAICVVAWAIAGFPRFTEVASVGGVGLLCFGVYCAWMIWDAKK